LTILSKYTIFICCTLHRKQPGMRLSTGRVADEIAPGNHLNVGTDFGINMKVGCNPRWFYDGDATRLPGVGIWAVKEL